MAACRRGRRPGVPRWRATAARLLSHKLKLTAKTAIKPQVCLELFSVLLDAPGFNYSLKSPNTSARICLPSPRGGASPEMVAPLLWQSHCNPSSIPFVRGSGWRGLGGLLGDSLGKPKSSQGTAQIVLYTNLSFSLVYSVSKKEMLWRNKYFALLVTAGNRSFFAAGQSHNCDSQL